MPAFQLSQQPPADLLQLCGGVKRKTESGVEEEVDYLCRPSYDQFSSPKRMCLCPEESFNSVGNVLPLYENDQKEISCNLSQTRSVIVYATSTDRHMTSVMQPMPQLDSFPRVGETLSAADGVTSESQTMDCMEVDCNSTSGEHQVPCDDQTPNQEIQAQIDRQFCDDYCGFGSVSPASGLLRCYCRPSWEGMVEMQPYGSDYY